MDKIYKHKRLISIMIVAAIVYARCDLGIALGMQYVLANVLANALGVAWCLALFVKDKATTKKALLNPAMAWALAFSILVFIYGHFKLGVYTDMYSRQYHILTVVPAILIMVILFHHKDDMLDVISNAGCIVIPLTLVTSLLFDPVWKQLFMGNAYRVGATPAGTCVDTGNLLLIMLIPLMYQLIINRKFKAYLWAAILAIGQIFASGSKSSVLPIILVFAVMLLGAAKDKKTIRRNIIILVIIAVCGSVAVMVIPALYSIIGERIVEMISGVGSTDYDLHTSTGQRMAVIAAVKEHFWEHPIFGHGFYAFKQMAYSQLEEYRPNDGVEIAYRNIHTHMNYLELLFSFGIFGFVMYYWFPVYLIIKSFFTKNKMAKLIIFSFMISFVFMDLGIDMFYKYMTPYYTYLVAYCLLKQEDK